MPQSDPTRALAGAGIPASTEAMMFRPRAPMIRPTGWEGHLGALSMLVGEFSEGMHEAKLLNYLRSEESNRQALHAYLSEAQRLLSDPNALTREGREEVARRYATVLSSIIDQGGKGAGKAKGDQQGIGGLFKQILKVGLGTITGGEVPSATLGKIDIKKEIGELHSIAQAHSPARVEQEIGQRIIQRVNELRSANPNVTREEVLSDQHIASLIGHATRSIGRVPTEASLLIETLRQRGGPEEELIYSILAGQRAAMSHAPAAPPEMAGQAPPASAGPATAGPVAAPRTETLQPEDIGTQTQRGFVAPVQPPATTAPASPATPAAPVAPPGSPTAATPSAAITPYAATAPTAAAAHAAAQPGFSPQQGLTSAVLYVLQKSNLISQPAEVLMPDGRIANAVYINPGASLYGVQPGWYEATTMRRLPDETIEHKRERPFVVSMFDKTRNADMTYLVYPDGRKIAIGQSARDPHRAIIEKDELDIRNRALNYLVDIERRYYQSLRDADKWLAQAMNTINTKNISAIQQLGFNIATEEFTKNEEAATEKARRMALDQHYLRKKEAERYREEELRSWNDMFGSFASVKPFSQSVERRIEEPSAEQGLPPGVFTGRQLREGF